MFHCVFWVCVYGQATSVSVGACSMIWFLPIEITVVGDYGFERHCPLAPILYTLQVPPIPFILSEYLKETVADKLL